MDLIDKHLIDCVIVKDLSRLGRNYIETGRYIDQIFPMLGVRFISVNDNYDSSKESTDADQIIIPFKNLINDAYCRDISIKVRSQLDTKRKKGKFIGSFPGYGYKKDPADKNHLIIDDKAAEVVKQIFNWRLEGYSQGRIAKKLNEMGVLPPMEYKRSQGMNFATGLRKRDVSQWYPGNVSMILKNDLYIGTVTQGKKRKINYKLKQLQDVDESEWIHVADMHEPIISKEVFERAQMLDRKDMRVSSGRDTVRIFSGILKCGHCGQNMIARRVHSGQKDHYYYICSTKKNGQGCDYHSISSKKLEAAVKEILQKQVQIALDFDQLARIMDHQPLQSHRIKLLDEQIGTMESEIKRLRDLKEHLYEDFTQGIVDESDYLELKKRFDYKIEQAGNALGEVKSKKEDILNEPLLPPDWISEIRQYGHVSELSRKMLIMLVDEILVYSKNEIEIKFHYGDEIAAFAGFIGKEPVDPKGVVS